MAMRTIILKLYRPGKRKREILDKALESYSKAYQYLLDQALGQIGEIRSNYMDNKGNYRAANVSAWIDRDISRELNSFGIEPFKDSLKIDFGMTLASYLSLGRVQKHVSYPIAYVSDEQFREKFSHMEQQMAKSGKDADAVERELSKLERKAGCFKPLFFCRNAINRDFSILYDAASQRYFAKLYLMNVKSEDRKALYTQTDRELMHIQREGKLLDKTSKRERYLVFPLSFGQWQEQYLRQALDHPDMIKTARLSKVGGEYYLAVSIDIGEAARLETHTYMGIGRGLRHAIDYTVVNSAGEVVDRGYLTEHKEGHTVTVNAIYRYANQLASIAGAHCAQVVMQSLINKGDRLQWMDEDSKLHKPILKCFDYNRILRVLDYKLPEQGLLQPIRVSPVNIFYRCPVCGHHSRQNRFSEEMFICVGCGNAMGIEELGSLNLATKLIQYGDGVLKIKAERIPEGVRFTNSSIGLDFVPANPMDCLDEFRQELDRLAEDFFNHLHMYREDRSFKKKYSLMKKIIEERDLTKLIHTV